MLSKHKVLHLLLALCACVYSRMHTHTHKGQAETEAHKSISLEDILLGEITSNEDS